MPAQPRTPRKTDAPDPQGIRLLRSLVGEGRYIFDMAEAKEAARKLGISEAYLREALFRLAKTDWVKRLRKGLYATTGSISPEAQVHPFAIATRLVTPSAIGHWSALSHHGLTEQLPRAVSAMTTSKVLTPGMRRGKKEKGARKHGWWVLGVRYEYVTVKKEHFFGVEEVWVDQAFRVPIADKERVALDLFAMPKLFGGLGEGLGILEEHGKDLDLEKLVRYALRYGKVSVSKRLGWCLERTGARAKLLRPLRDLPIEGFRILDPTRPKRGSCDKRWMVLDNLTSGKEAS